MEKSLSNSSHQIEGFIQQILNHNSQNVPQGRIETPTREVSLASGDKI